MKQVSADLKPILNAYPDSLGSSLRDAVSFLEDSRIAGAFSTFYILPSLYQHDLDRGFSVISYDLNTALAQPEDIARLKALGVGLKLDFVLNHASTQSPQFLSVIENGSSSPYKGLFLDWNAFWEGCGDVGPDGYIIPKKEYTEKMFFRKPGYPVITIDCENGEQLHFWNTFYQAVQKDTDGREIYCGQIDLDSTSEITWEFYRSSMRKILSYGANIIRLDAFAYLSKIPGRYNFMNDPETWDYLETVRQLVGEEAALLPEIHATYAEGGYREMAERSYMIYDFFLPGLLLDAIETGDGSYLSDWIQELTRLKVTAVNMLGCHDGIPLLDLQGLLPDDRIHAVIDLLVSRGGNVSKLFAETNMYYQVECTYFTALGESEQKLLLARAIQLFMPGKPQVWYLDLFAGKNDYTIVQQDMRDINRANISLDDIAVGLERDIVKRQLNLLKFRSSFPVFTAEADITSEFSEGILTIRWQTEQHTAAIFADLNQATFTIQADEEYIPF